MMLFKVGVGARSEGGQGASNKETVARPTSANPVPLALVSAVLP